MKALVFIDESGTIGKKKKEPYFIIAALVLKQEQKKPLKNLVVKLKKEFKTKELHASKMIFAQKERFFNLLENREYQYQYFVAEKDKIEESLFNKKSVCFNYFIYLFLKNLLDKKEISEIEIIIDTRNIKVTSVATLEDYLQLKLVEKGDYNKKISAIYGNSENYTYLQIVDILANALYAKYNYGNKHFFKKIKGKLLHREYFPQYKFTTIDND